MEFEQKDVRDMTHKEYATYQKALFRAIEVQELRQRDERANQAAMMQYQPTTTAGGNTK